MPLSEKLKEHRKRCGLSQEKVAELVGVSRQAVTKWETGQSAPSTENLLKLAQIFGITADVLLTGEETQKGSVAQQVYALFQAEAARKALAQKTQRKKNALMTLAVVGGYLVIYLLARIFGTPMEDISWKTWLFTTDPKLTSYLYGWLLHQNLFWIALVISALPALFGKYRFSFTTLAMFGLGLGVGEWLGKNPAGAAYGHDHYGWAIWGGIFLLSLALGIVLEKLPKEKRTLRSWQLWVWCGAGLVGTVAVVLAVRGSFFQGPIG